MEIRLDEETKRPRKKERKLKNWKANRAKLERYSSPGLPPNRFGCKHSTMKNAFACWNVTSRDIIKFHSTFYYNKTKIDQDNFILKFTFAEPTKRTRFVTNKRESNDFSYSYFMIKDGKRTRICQKAFLEMLLLSKNRVQGILKRNLASGQSPKEGRGGDRKKLLFARRQQAVAQFIKKLKCLESDYCRGKLKRVYMQSDLNISRLYKLYCDENESDDTKVTSSFFRKVFRTKCNIGFDSPKTDESSTYLSLSEQINQTND